MLITGKPGGDIDYFRLHINQYNTIQTITCLSKRVNEHYNRKEYLMNEEFCIIMFIYIYINVLQLFPMENLMCLYELHERMLNNLVSRFDEKLITNLYRYWPSSLNFGIHSYIYNVLTCLYALWCGPRIASLPLPRYVVRCY